MKLLTLVASAFLATSVSAYIGSPIAPLDDSSDLSVPGENPLKHCQDPKDDILDLQSVDLDPNPPKAGETLSIIGKGVLHEDVGEGAKIHLQVKYGLITIIKSDFDLCDNVKEVNLTCPLEKDKVTTLKKDVGLPKEIPPGKYTVSADLVTKESDRITCLQAQVEFHRGKSEQNILDSWKQGL